MRRRFIATLLALCMALGMLPGTAFAENRAANRTTSEVVVSLPDLTPQILYYNDKGQVAGCINFKMSTDTGDTYFETVEVVLFEYDANGRLKSSECSYPRESYGYRRTYFNSPDGHLDYTYENGEIMAWTTEDELWCIRNEKGYVKFWYVFEDSAEYKYQYDSSGNLSEVSNGSRTYDITCNESGQIVRGDLQNWPDGWWSSAVYTYDSSGKIISTDLPVGNTHYGISLAYDAQGELSAIQGGIDDNGYWGFSDYTFSNRRVGSNLEVTITRFQENAHIDDTYKLTIPMGTVEPTYSFAYLMNGGSGNIPEERYSYPEGKSIAITSEIPIRNGYSFRGWSDGSRTYQPGETFAMPARDTELTAVWEAQRPTPSFFWISRNSVSLTEGATASPRFSVTDGAAVTWTSADSSIASVDTNGKVTGVKKGTTTITGVATDGMQTQSLSYEVYVSPGSKVTFRDPVVNLKPEQSAQLVYTVWPTSMHDKVSFRSSDPSVAEVSSEGVVSAKKPGTATIRGYFTYLGMERYGECTIAVGNNLAEEFVNEALKYVGYSGDQFENATGHTVTQGNWCSDFIGVCAELVGAGKAIPKESAGWLLSQKIVGKGGSIVDEPKVGDIITFKTPTGYGHVGIVCDVNVDNNTVYVVHGNWHKHVCAPNGYGANNQNCIRYSADKNKDKSQSCGKWNIKTKEGSGATIDLYTRPDWNSATGVKCGTLECKFKCPIDVRFAYDDEVLDSATEQFEASFGTMERTDDGGLLVRLNNYYAVDVTINGIGVGTMDITSTFQDSDGTASIRKFQGVSITEDTIGKLFVCDSASTEILEIYRDRGDTFVEVWAADGNETVSTADQELTDWYINGDTSDREPAAPTPDYSVPSVSGTSNTNTYAIIAQAVPNGKVTISPATARKGATVTLTATPDEGYELASLTVTDSKGNALELTGMGNGKYTFTMPDGKVSVDAVFSAIVSEDPPAEQPVSLPFTDVPPAEWFYSSVQYVYTHGLMTGTTPATFSPDAPMTRAMAWTLLGRLAGADVDGGTPWYAKAQSWAVSGNVSDGSDPDGNITREQLVTMLYRQAGSPAAAADLAGFADSAEVSDWAVPAVQWAVANGLLKGDGGRLNPTASASRAEVAALLTRFCENIMP